MPKKSGRWLVEDIYVRDSGQLKPYLAPDRPRGFNKRRFFIWLMVAYGLFDLFLAGLWVTAQLAPPGTVPSPEQILTGAPQVLVGPNARRIPTQVAKSVQVPSNSVSPQTNSSSTGKSNVAPTVRPRPTANRPPTSAAPPVQIAAKNLSPASSFAFNLRSSLNIGALTIAVPPEPLECTHADQVPAVVPFSIKLCPGESYHPIFLRGQGIGVFGDDAKSAIIRPDGRTFGITAEGAGLFIRGVVIRASTAGADTGVMLCLYPNCRGNPGGSAYGGGILVHAPDTTVMDSDISGGVAGVAVENVTGVKILNNRLDRSTGWGSYNLSVSNAFFIGNSLNDDNRSCSTGDGFLPTGCESAGWVCIACQHNVIADNTCAHSGDCYYINGEGNLQSNQNRFHGNHCFASPHNCFEVTFSLGNEFVENVAEGDPYTGEACQYPFWIGGSHVFFARNEWKCTISPDKAFQHASDSTGVPTSIESAQ